MVALAAGTGAQLWSQPARGAGSLGMAFMLASELYVSGLRVDSTGNPSVLDPLTGAKKRYWQCNTGITCARVTVSPDAFYGGSGRGFNRNTNQSTEEMNLKSGCEEGTFAANGLLSGTPTSCGCNVLSRGFSVFGPAGALNFDPPVTTAARLEYGAGTPTVAPFASDANDWPVYRANNKHSAATAAPMPTANIVQLWQYQPPLRLKSSAPVAAGDCVFVGANDGGVRCLDARNGTLQWTFYTAGRVFAAPTIWSNRVYVGSADGYAYCLEAASGRMLWRFRAAPYERRIRIYGELLSTWPVHSSILIDDGIAYCAAGMVDLDGTHLYALDALTGALLWHNGTSGGLPALGTDRKGMIAAGHLAVLNSNLWMASGNVGSPAAYALSNGVVANLPRLRQATGLRGTELGVYGDTYLMYGGLLRWRPHDERRTLRDIDVAVQEISPTGQRLQPEIALGTNGYSIPAWDARHTLMVTKGIGSTLRDNMLLECWDTALTTSGVTQTRLANTSYQPAFSAWRLNIGTVNDTAPLPGYVHPKLWAVTGTQKETYACALAQNAAVAVFGNNYSPLATTWTMRAMHRDTGATLWEQTLPAEPLTDGLCLTHDGAAIVTLADGRVVAYGVVPEPVVAGVLVATAALATRARRTRPPLPNSTAPHIHEFMP
jgi:outer membrane protein assembly factor BamB